MERSWVPVLGILLAVGLFVALLPSGTDAPNGSTGGSEGDPRPDVGSGPVLRSRGSTPTASRVRVGEGLVVIRGRVVDFEGQPVAGRVVFVEREADTGGEFFDLDVEALEASFVPTRSERVRGAQAISAADGTFEIGGLEIRERYRIHAEARAGELSVPAWHAKEGMPRGPAVRLAVGPGVPFAGAVVDAAGQGIRAWVSMHVPSHDEAVDPLLRDWRSKPQQTNEDGTFLFPAVPEGELHIDVYVSDKMRLGCRAVHAPSEPGFLIRLHELGTASLEGSLRSSEGEPIANGRVLLNLRTSKGHDEWSVHTTSSGPGGSYRFDGLPGGQVEALSVATAADGSVAGLHRGLTLTSGQVTRADVQFPATGMIRGVAVDPDGRPLADITVVLLGRALVMSEEFARTRTDAAGRFSFARIRVGTLEVDAWGAGWVLTQPDPEEGSLARALQRRRRPLVQIPAASSPSSSSGAELRIQLKPAVALQGRVVRTDGAPVSGASVTASPRRLSAPSGRLASLHAETNAAGLFRLENLDPSLAWRVEASAVEGRSGPMQVAGKEIARGATPELKLLPLQQVTGHVKTVDGSPRPALSVGISNLALWAPVDRAGRFVLQEVPLGPRTLTLRSSATYLRDPPTLAVDVRPGGTEGVEIVWDRVYRVTGFVRGHDGTPQVGAEVRAQAADAKGWGGQSETTDEEGRFEISWLAPGPLKVTIDGEAVETQIEAGSEGVTLRTPGPPRRTLTIKLLDPEGVPLGGRARIQAYRSAALTGEPLAQGFASHGDPVDLRVPLDAAHLTLVVKSGTRGNGVADLLPRHVVADVSTQAEDVLEVRIPLGHRIQGHIHSDTGTPLKGVTVNVTSTADGEVRHWDGPLHSTRTDQKGAFSFSGVGPGVTVLEIPAQGAFAGVPSLAVPVDAEPIDIRLSRGEVLEVELRDPDGAPLTNRSMALLDDADNSVQHHPLKADATEGHIYRSEPLKPGRYVLSVDAGGGLRALTRKITAPTERLRVALQRALWVRGTIQHPKATEFEIEFQRRGRDGTFGFADYTSSNAEGAFEFHLHPDDEGLIYATMEEKDLYVLALNVGKATGLLTLTPQRGVRLKGRVDHEKAGGGWITITHENGATWLEQLSAEGHFEIRAVPPGSCTCTWKHAGETYSATGVAGGTDLILR